MIHPVRLDAYHKYWIPAPGGEKQVPGFSEICLAMGVTRPNKFYTPQGRAEGEALHLWLGFLARGKVPSGAPDPRIAGRVAGIKKFIKDTGFKIMDGEQPIYDPSNRFACTPDMWGPIGKTAWVIDCKRGAKLDSHGLQTAAQKMALIENDFWPQKRGCLYLRDNDYRLHEHSDHQQELDWRAIVRAYHALAPDDRAIFAAPEFKATAHFPPVIHSAWNARQRYN